MECADACTFLSSCDQLRPPAAACKHDALPGKLLQAAVLPGIYQASGCNQMTSRVWLEQLRLLEVQEAASNGMQESQAGMFLSQAHMQAHIPLPIIFDYFPN